MIDALTVSFGGSGAVFQPVVSGSKRLDCGRAQTVSGDLRLRRPVFARMVKLFAVAAGRETHNGF